MSFWEIVKTALQALRRNKLRSALTLLGIVIGVTSIITIMTAIEAVQTYMESTLNVLGTSTFQVQKYPAIQLGPRDRARYRNRKNITVAHADALKERATFVRYVGAEVWRWGVSLRYGDELTDPIFLMSGGTPEFSVNNGYFVGEGRFLTQLDVDHARHVVVLGTDAVEKLFPFRYPIGEEIKIDGHRFDVIGVFEEQGSRFGQSRDNLAVIPITTFQKIYGSKRSINITVQAKSPEVLEAAKEEVAGILRVERRVPPSEENDFEMFSSNTLIQTWNDLSRSIKIGSILVGFIALGVAGIGIMNIMLVSVTERTREIGIRKALGARQRTILVQFTSEAVILCELGGLIGMVLGVAAGNVVGSFINVPVTLPVFWMLTGLLFCSVVGIVFGVYPAAKAARLDPVEALRYE